MKTKVVTHGLPYQFHSNQEQIEAAKARFKVIKAGKGFGKTVWALMSLLCNARQSGEYWYIAPTYRQAEDIAWRKLKEWIPRELMSRDPLETKLTIFLLSGVTICLKGADNPDSLRGVHGLKGIIFEEYAYQPGWIWGSILRGQLAADGWAYFISSPFRQGRNHFTQFCEKAMRDIKAGSKEWLYFHFKATDNPTRTAAEWKDIQANCTKEEWEIEYMANESAFSLTVYSEFCDDNIQDLDDWKGARHFKGLDWGGSGKYSHPTTCVPVRFFEDRKIIYINDEYVQKGLTIPDQIAGMRAQFHEDEWIHEVAVMDPSAAREDPVSNTSISDEYARHGLPCIPGDRSARGIKIVNMMFKKRMLVIHPRCTTLIKQLRDLQHGDKLNDDVPDCTRYIVTHIHDTEQGMDVVTDSGDFEAAPKHTKEEERANLNRAYKNTKFVVPLNSDEPICFEVPDWLKVA